MSDKNCINWHNRSVRRSRAATRRSQWRSWGHSGFSVHNPVRVPAEDPEGRKKLAGTIVEGALNPGGSIEMIPNAVRIAELAVDEQGRTLLMPVSGRGRSRKLPSAS